jgi:hypothetical protein
MRGRAAVLGLMVIEKPGTSCHIVSLIGVDIVDPNLAFSRVRVT